MMKTVLISVGATIAVLAILNRTSIGPTILGK